MELIDRFRYLMKLNRLSASAFAEEIGVQPSSVSHILSGRNKPSLDFIRKVLSRYPKVDANWLINGSNSFSGQQNLQEKESDALKTKHFAEEEKESQKVNELLKEDDLKQSGVLQGELNRLSKSRVKKIVIFYDDQTFDEFTP